MVSYQPGQSPEQEPREQEPPEQESRDRGPGSAGGDRNRRPGTRWRRFAIAVVPALLVSGAILVATAQGALAASFAVAGSSFKIHADRLEGQGFIQYGTVDSSVDGKKHPVAVNAFRTAQLYSLCQSIVIPTPFRTMTIRLTAGSGSKPVKATNLVTDLDLLTGDVTFNDPRIGIDASTSARGPVRGPKGGIGIDADSVSIKNADIQAWATTAGTFTLNHLKMTAAFGKNECF